MSQHPYEPTHAPHPYDAGRAPRTVEGSKAAQASLIFGIVGLFVLGIVFGPLALLQARKAERLNTSATAGKVLGWISTIWGVLSLILLVVFFGAVAALMPLSGY
ncbi:hypothetical protein ACX80W_00145 [Arthrobacter sp. TMN-37]